MPCRVVLALLLLALAQPAIARARDDVRAAGACGRGASAELRVKADHDALRIELRVRRDRAGERWRV
ncbi:MAG TPA: hypothetical protein VF250_05870, partial [Conexibacter sp.]